MIFKIQSRRKMNCAKTQKYFLKSFWMLEVLAKIGAHSNRAQFFSMILILQEFDLHQFASAEDKNE